MELRNITFGKRLTLCIGVILAAFVAALVAQAVTFEIERGALLRAIDTAVAKQTHAADMRSALLGSAVSIRNLGLQTTVEGAQAQEAEAKRERAEYLARTKALEAEGIGDADRRIFSRLTEIDRAMDAEFKEAVALASQFNTDQAAKIIVERIDPLLKNAMAQLEALIALQKKNVIQAKTEAETRQHAVTTALTLGCALVIGAAALLAWRLTLSITRPMRAAKAAVDRVRQGDLGCTIEASGRDEAAAVLNGLIEMRDGLARIVERVRSGADNICNGAREIAGGNADLSRRTESQASNLQQTAASIEHIHASVRRNTETAGQANEAAGAAREAAVDGGRQVRQVVETMEDIRAAAAKMADIIGVIDGIAFQTNILALNAAVEAARAGEQGRGFAVVAAEVRGLAGRSSEAAKEIKSLIGASIDKTEAGSRLVANAGQTVSEIVERVQRVATLIDAISATQREQADGVGQINQAIVQLDQVTQQNAALVEQSAAAAESLNQQASGMVEVVQLFKLAQQAPAAA